MSAPLSSHWPPKARGAQGKQFVLQRVCNLVCSAYFEADPNCETDSDCFCGMSRSDEALYSNDWKAIELLEEALRDYVLKRRKNADLPSSS